MPVERKGGKKNRKFGRIGRRPAHARYNGEERWLINKARKIKKQAKFEAKKKAKREKRSGEVG